MMIRLFVFSILSCFGLLNVNQLYTQVYTQEKDVPVEMEKLISALKDKDPKVRADAAEKLGKTKNVAAVEPLIVALKDENYTVRPRAAEALGELGYKRAVEPLVAVLMDTLSSYKDITSWYLTEDVRVYVLIAEGLISDLGATAAIALGRIGDPSNQLISALKDKDSRIRRNAALGLGVMKNSSAVEFLIHALQDNDFWAKGNAILALKMIMDKKAIEPLKALAKNDPNSSISKSAQEALETIQKGGAK